LITTIYDCKQHTSNNIDMLLWDIFNVKSNLYLILFIQNIIVYIFRSTLDKAEKIALLSKLSQPVNHIEDAETISQVNSESEDDCMFNNVREVKSDSKNFMQNTLKVRQKL